MQNAPTDAAAQAAHTFIQRWQGVTASESSTAQSLVRELCELLGVEVPHATAEESYMFERPITFHHGDGSTSPGRVDCYRRGHSLAAARVSRPGRRQGRRQRAINSRADCAHPEWATSRFDT